eukprot:COSAG06_NODE_62902_length_263_cov_3.445122_1_plen_21_part_01
MAAVVLALALAPALKSLLLLL